MAKEGPPQPSIIDTLGIQAAQLIYLKDRANPRDVFALSEKHRNPPMLFDDFQSDNSLGSVSPSDLWDVAFINGNGKVAHPPQGEAADILIGSNMLTLQVRHDSHFEEKSSKWKDGTPASEQYNNAYVTGLRGFMPKPKEIIVMEGRMRVSEGFHGSTGIWMEEAGTFAAHTGVMRKPFRAFGFSFVGDSSDPYIRGLAVETALGLSVQQKISIPDIDVTAWHVYKTYWSWQDDRHQSVQFFVDDQSVGILPLDPFGPGEVQLWADNYKIGKYLRIGFLNVPDVDQTQYDWMSVKAVKS